MMEESLTLKQGLSHTSRLLISDNHTAIAAGSGDMPVLATPMMLALMENAAMLAVAGHLPDGCTTVGGHIASSHVKPTGVGVEVTATAELIEVKGRKLIFKITANEGDILIGEGTHLRFIVERERFLSQLGEE